MKIELEQERKVIKKRTRSSKICKNIIDDQGKNQSLNYDNIEKEKETVVPQSMDNNESIDNIESIDVKYPSTSCSLADKSHLSIKKQQVSDAKDEKLKKKN